ncbi:hypothetical protein [Paenibacillus sp. YIM B09110]|uniref:hypothetical protein n=1 Tax=Paenibacillus sp. YIM B09110 TaxID=3126102 RepID=UPI00301C1F1B
MSNELTRNSIRRTNANHTHLSRIISQYNGTLPGDYDAADLVPRNLIGKGVRLA